MEPETVTIYALIDPKNGEVRYVGKTIGCPRRRLVHHLCKAKRGKCQLPISRWLRKVRSTGQRPVVRELEIAPIAQWAERERHWILHYRQRARLLNMTDGGEGQHGFKWAGTERAKKLGEANRRGAYFNCEACGKSFYRKRKDIKDGECRFCSKPCYFTWQVGKHKAIPPHTIAKAIAAAAAMRRAKRALQHG